MHSPFIYNFLIKCLYATSSKQNLKQLKQNRRVFFNSNKVIQMTDSGQGSQRFKTTSRNVKTIAKKAGMPWHQSKLMNKVIGYFNIKSALELGTSIGLGSVAMATNHSDLQIETIEACPNTSTFAKSKFEELRLINIKVYNQDFQSYLKQLSKDKKFDLIYIDGHHQKEATINYFISVKKHIHSKSIIILDDIYWSKGMQEAWQTICKDPKVKVSIDLYFWGIVFVNPNLTKQDFKIRCFF